MFPFYSIQFNTDEGKEFIATTPPSLPNHLLQGHNGTTCKITQTEYVTLEHTSFLHCTILLNLLSSKDKPTMNPYAIHKLIACFLLDVVLISLDFGEKLPEL